MNNLSDILGTAKSDKHVLHTIINVGRYNDIILEDCGRKIYNKLSGYPDVREIVIQAELEAKHAGRDAGFEHVILAMYEIVYEFRSACQAYNLDRPQLMRNIQKFYAVMGEKTALELFTWNLNKLSISKDPAVMREHEIERVMQVMRRRKKPNPVLVGVAGVGKTAIVYELARRFHGGKQPDKLKNTVILQLNMPKLVSTGAKVGGMESIIDQLRRELHYKQKEENVEIFLFIDELHTIVGAGGTGGKNSDDLANLMKPLLSDGELRVIGSTTFDEYRKNIESDGALNRRFLPVPVFQPDEDRLDNMVRAVVSMYEKFHAVRVANTAVQAIIKLSLRYMSYHAQPDGAIELLDETCAVVSLANRNLVVREDVENIVSKKTGIPVNTLRKDELEVLSNLEGRIHERLIGQDNAVEAVAKSVRRNRTGLTINKRRPVGSFLFLGPTGVGKTELARTLAYTMFNDEDALIKLDMSEYREQHSISRLFGSPPGYVGYYEGGQLTEEVRRKPYSVILFDEIEKAHPVVHRTTLQILEDGVMTDGSGRKVIFSHSVVIMTSNLLPDMWGEKVNRKELYHRLNQAFSPEFVNRLDDVVVFHHLTKDNIEDICDLKIKTLAQVTGYKFQIAKDVKGFLCDVGYNTTYGARALNRAIDRHIIDQTAKAVTKGEIEQGATVNFSLVNGYPAII